MSDLLEMRLKNRTREHAKKRIDTMAEYKLTVSNEKSLDSQLKSTMTRKIRRNLKYYMDNEITIIEFDWKARIYTMELYFNIYESQEEIYATIEKLEFILRSRKEEAPTVVFDIYNS